MIVLDLVITLALTVFSLEILPGKEHFRPELPLFGEIASRNMADTNAWIPVCLPDRADHLGFLRDFFDCSILDTKTV